MKVVLTCEHAGNQIPREYKYLFENDWEVLKTHRAYDPGAFDLFQKLSDLSDFKYSHFISRLLVEVNRSIGHPRLFSEFTKKLSTSEKTAILNQYYFPYRNTAEKTISENIQKGGRLLHLSVHSFTPVLQGEVRNTDIGLLYDPSHKLEKDFCKILKQQLLAVSPEVKVRFNYPYLGIADGFTTYFRKRFPDNYAGIEIEINQKYVKNKKLADRIKNSVHQALQTSILQF